MLFKRFYGTFFDSFAFIAQADLVMAKPPLPVHLTQVGICLLTDDTVSITLFKGISALYPAQAIVADDKALTAALTFSLNMVPLLGLLLDHKLIQSYSESPWKLRQWLV